MQSSLYSDRFAQTLSRTSSATSVSSVDTHSSYDDDNILGLGISAYTPTHPLPFEHDDPPRRTRKRFSSTQLMMLEHLYHQTSHPTREQREVLAREANIELRSVTVWFQNKRQTERKVALSATPNGNATATTHSSAAHRDATPRRAHHSQQAVTLSASSTRTVRTHSQPVLSISMGPPQHSHHSSRHSHQSTLDKESERHRRPSLDHIASRSEQRTPTRPSLALSLSLPSLPMSSFGSASDHMHRENISLSRSISVAELWANTPSSPMSSPPSPMSHDRDQELLDFFVGRGGERRAKPTLEYACAAARVSGRSLVEDDDDLLPVTALSASGRRTTSARGQSSLKKKLKRRTTDKSFGKKSGTGHWDDEMDVDTPRADSNDRMLTSDIGGDTETETETESYTEGPDDNSMDVSAPVTGHLMCGSGNSDNEDRISNDLDDDNDDDDAHEAVTPHSSQDSITIDRAGRTRTIRPTPRVRVESQGSLSSVDLGVRAHTGRRDDKTMDAALALCGLAGL